MDKIKNKIKANLKASEEVHQNNLGLQNEDGANKEVLDKRKEALKVFKIPTFSGKTIIVTRHPDTLANRENDGMKDDDTPVVDEELLFLSDKDKNFPPGSFAQKMHNEGILLGESTKRTKMLVAPNLRCLQGAGITANIRGLEMEGYPEDKNVLKNRLNLYALAELMERSVSWIENIEEEDFSLEGITVMIEENEMEFQYLDNMLDIDMYDEDKIKEHGYDRSKIDEKRFERILKHKQSKVFSEIKQFLKDNEEEFMDKNHLKKAEVLSIFQNKINNVVETIDTLEESFPDRLEVETNLNTRRKGNKYAVNKYKTGDLKVDRTESNLGAMQRYANTLNTLKENILTNEKYDVIKCFSHRNMIELAKHETLLGKNDIKTSKVKSKTGESVFGLVDNQGEFIPNDHRLYETLDASEYQEIMVQFGEEIGIVDNDSYQVKQRKINGFLHSLKDEIGALVKNDNRKAIYEYFASHPIVFGRVVDYLLDLDEVQFKPIMLGFLDSGFIDLGDEESMALVKKLQENNSTDWLWKQAFAQLWLHDEKTAIEASKESDDIATILNEIHEVSHKWTGQSLNQGDRQKIITLLGYDHKSSSYGALFSLFNEGNIHKISAIISFIPGLEMLLASRYGNENDLMKIASLLEEMSLFMPFGILRKDLDLICKKQGLSMKEITPLLYEVGFLIDGENQKNGHKVITFSDHSLELFLQNTLHDRYTVSLDDSMQSVIQSIQNNEGLNQKQKNAMILTIKSEASGQDIQGWVDYIIDHLGSERDYDNPLSPTYHAEVSRLKTLFELTKKAGSGNEELAILINKYQAKRSSYLNLAEKDVISRISREHGLNIGKEDEYMIEVKEITNQYLKASFKMYGFSDLETAINTGAKQIQKILGENSLNGYFKNYTDVYYTHNTGKTLIKNNFIRFLCENNILEYSLNQTAFNKLIEGDDRFYMTDFHSLKESLPLNMRNSSLTHMASMSLQKLLTSHGITDIYSFLEGKYIKTDLRSKSLQVIGKILGVDQGSNFSLVSFYDLCSKIGPLYDFDSFALHLLQNNSSDGVFDVRTFYEQLEIGGSKAVRIFFKLFHHVFSDVDTNAVLKANSSKNKKMSRALFKKTVLANPSIFGITSFDSAIEGVLPYDDFDLSLKYLFNEADIRKQVLNDKKLKEDQKDMVLDYILHDIKESEFKLKYPNAGKNIHSAYNSVRSKSKRILYALQKSLSSTTQFE